MTDINYLPPGFYFTVAFSNEADALDGSFQEVNGISTDIETASIDSGDENRFRYKLPKQTGYSNLVLKRGLLSSDSELLKWVQNCLTVGLTDQIEVKPLFVKLLDNNNDIIRSWTFENAYPIKFTIGSLIANAREVAVDSIEFSFSYFSRKI
ncbi:MAG TPA: phage tail protein [Bacteroidales bacterium]|nr:phage tail protein [Bacteroidales bacterium]